MESQTAAFKGLKNAQSAMGGDSIIKSILQEDLIPDNESSEIQKLHLDIDKFKGYIDILKNGQSHITQQLQQVIQ